MIADNEVKDALIETQRENAEHFLRHLASAHESSCLTPLSTGILRDSTRIGGFRAKWRLWTLHESWTDNPSLQFSSDSRSLDAISLDILAILGDKSAKVVRLLSLLQGMQKGATASQDINAAVLQDLLKSTIDSVGDSRLHLMHRVSMWQLINIIAIEEEHLLQFHQHLATVDRKVSALVDTLKAWAIDPKSDLAMDNAVFNNNIAFVGFNGDPPGIAMVGCKEFMFRWVDFTYIETSIKEIQFKSTYKKVYKLSLDTRELSLWALLHL